MNDAKEFGFMVIGALILALLVVLLVYYWWAILGIVAMVVGYLIWKNDPNRKEREAAEELDRLYKRALDLFSEEKFTDRIKEYSPPHVRENGEILLTLYLTAHKILQVEGVNFVVPKPPPVADSLAGAKYKDTLSNINSQGDKVDVVARAIGNVAKWIPDTEGSLRVPLSTQLSADKLLDIMSKIPSIKDLRDSYPTHASAEEIIKDTVLEDLHTIPLPFSIPDKVRPEHMWILGGSGAGKSQTLQYFLQEDIDAINDGERSAIVIDSKNDLIPALLQSDIDPDRIVLLDAEDVEHPLALNLFAVPERFAEYSTFEREKLTNTLIELYSYLISDLLDAQMTAKQTTVFDFLVMLLIKIPGANILTLRDLLEPGGSAMYREYIDQLEGTARDFFEREFDGRDFRSTREQVLRRLYGVLKNRTFERMFTGTENKIDLFAEMNAGKLILINASENLLGEDGAKLFGKFFIALIQIAAAERQTTGKKVRTHVYIDEAYMYFSTKIEALLTRARSANIGITLAHQFIGQLNMGLLQALEANTAVKMAGGISARDAQALGKQMNVDQQELQHAPKGTFYTYIKGTTRSAVPLAIPFGHLSTDENHREDAQAIARERYSYQRKEPDEPPRQEEQAEETQAEDVEKQPEDVPERGEW